RQRLIIADCELRTVDLWIYSIADAKSRLKLYQSAICNPQSAIRNPQFRMARVLSAIIFLPVLFAVLWLGSPIWFSSIAAAAILLGLYEYYRLASRGREVQGLAAAAATIAAFYF